MVENENIENVDVEQAKVKEVFNCKCPGCGAELQYDPGATMLKCPFCGTTKAVDWSKKTSEQDFNKLFEATDNSWAEETCVIACKNCGVKEVVNKKEIGKCCSYCGTPNVVRTEELAGVKPNGVVPFSITKDAASECVKKWAKKRFYAVSKFKKHIDPQDINGVYDPAFTFDSDTRSVYKGRLGKHYYTTETRNGKTVTVQHTRYFDISGTYGFFFDDILVEASATINQKYIDGISPFDTNNAQDYNESFILGFSANQYSKDGKQCWDYAKSVMDKTIRKKILAQYQYDVIDYLDIKTERFNVTYKYLLLPIYVGHCAYRAKNYNFFVNGKTGKVAGKFPVSVVKVLLTVIFVLALIAGAVYLYMTYGG